MDKTFVKFGVTETEKQKFHQHKSPFLINSLDINKIVVCNNVKKVLNVLLVKKMLTK